MLQHLANC